MNRSDGEAASPLEQKPSEGVDMFNDYFYKWYPEIYRNNTLHLTAEQDGIYRRLIDHYMLSRQPLPDNDAALARIAGVDISTMVATMVKLRLFFGSTDGKLTHDFCNRMLDEQDSYSKKQSEKGIRSAKKRKLKAIEKQRELNSGLTVVQPSLNQASTKEKDKEKDKEYRESDKSLSVCASDFETFWTTYPKNNGSKQEALKKYGIAIKSGITSEQLRAGARAYAEHVFREGTERRYIAHAATWLNQKRWEVDYTADKAKTTGWQSESNKLLEKVRSGEFNPRGDGAIHHGSNAALPNTSQLRENGIEFRRDDFGIPALPATIQRKTTD